MENKLMLSPKIRSLLKAVHLLCVGCALGTFVAMFVLVRLKTHAKSGLLPFSVDYGVYWLFNGPLTYSFAGIVATAMAYAFFTPWGFLKHRWIVVKWIGVVALFAGAMFWLGPAINGMVALSDSGLNAGGARAEYLQHTANSFRLSVSGAAFMLALVTVSTLKPWGIRKTDFNLRRKAVLIPLGVLAIIGAAGGAMNTVQLKKIRSIQIANTDLSSIRDGVYAGETKMDFVYRVEVTVRDHAIQSVRVVANRKSAYARFAEGVVPKILAAQNANVEAVTGATTTSRCLLKAMEDALSKGSETR
jgi:uncharacterized protein with FMN-binding domain